MKKRLISLLLVVCTMLQLFAGCAKGEKDQVTQGAMLTEICDAFGMYSYTSDTPYLDSVSADDPYFSVVQACVEWDIIPEDDKYDVNKNVTRKDLALAVVNAAELAEEGTTDEEKLAIAAEYQLVETKADGKIKEKATVKQEEITNAINTAQALWAGKTYDTPVEKIVLQEGVKDYGIEGTDGNVVTDYYTDGNKIYVPVSSGIDIQAGDGYVLGNNGEGMTSGVAAEVKTEGDYYVITNQEFDDELAELLAVVGELKVQGTYEPDLLNTGTILDGNGNPMELTYENETSASTMSSSGTMAYAHKMSSSSGASTRILSSGNTSSVSNVPARATSLVSARQLGSVKGSFKFKTSGVDISGTIGKDYIDFALQVPVGGGGVSKTAVRISDFKPTVDLDIGWSGIENASAKLDYEMKITETLEWQKARSINGEFFYSGGEALLGLESEAKNAQGKGATKTIAVAAIPFVTIGVADLSLVIKATVSISGSVRISVELAGSMGAQYKDGSLRYYKDTSADVDVNLKAKLELTAGITFGVFALGKEVVGITGEGGVGGTFAVILHVVDAEGHLVATQTASGLSGDMADEIGNVPIIGYASDIAAAAELAGGFYNGEQSLDTKVNLHLDPCVEIKAYKILRFGISSESLLAKWVAGKAKLSFDVWGETIKTAELFKVHIDDFKVSWTDGLHAYVGKECSKSFTPWDTEKAENVEPTETLFEESKAPVDETPEHLVIDIDSYILTLSEGETARIEISRMPNGYSEDDVKWTTSDSTVATVSSDGTVSGVAEGSAVITASLKDCPDVKVSCSVTVLSNGNDGRIVAESDRERGLKAGDSSLRLVQM